MHLVDERIRFRVRQLVLPVTIDDSPETVQQLGKGDSLGLFPRLGLPRWVAVLAQKNTSPTSRSPHTSEQPRGLRVPVQLGGVRSESTILDGWTGGFDMGQHLASGSSGELGTLPWGGQLRPVAVCPASPESPVIRSARLDGVTHG